MTNIMYVYVYFLGLVLLLGIAIILLIFVLTPKELNDVLSLELWEKKPIKRYGETIIKIVMLSILLIGSIPFSIYKIITKKK